MNVVVWVVTGAFVFLGFIAVHELGHAVAARLIGVPADHVAIRLTEWPAHVALRADDQWQSPGTDDYQRAYARYDPELRWLGAFIAAGFVIQTVAMAGVVAVSLGLGGDDFGARAARVSTVVNGLYLVGDAAATVAARSPAGDMSSLLRHTPAVGMTTLGLLVGAHVAAFRLVS